MITVIEIGCANTAPALKQRSDRANKKTEVVNS